MDGNITYMLSVSAYHPAAVGSNPKHNIYQFIWLKIML